MRFSSRLSRPSGLVLVLFVAALTAGSSLALAAPTTSRKVVKEAPIESGQTVLASMRGRTLYSLSIETHGKFICTGTCLSVWHPLVVPKTVKPAGPVALGTVKRPDGRIQVTYKGRPLYSFTGDSQKGEGNGEGIKDVGTWHVAQTAAASTDNPPAPAPVPGYPPTTQPAPQPETPPTPPKENPYPYPPY